MAQYKVYPQAAGAGNSALTEAGRTLEDLRDQARQVYLRLDFQIRCREDLERRMERSIRVLEEQSGDAYRLAAGISRAMERYRAAESDILRQTWGVKDVGGGAVAGDPTGNSASWWQDLLDNTYDFFSMLGGVSMDLLDDLIPGWVGTVLSLLDNINDNLEEFGADLSNPLLYLETIGQTAFDGIVAGVAILVGGIPGVAISVVYTVADWAVEVLTGEDISDWVIDGGVALTQWVAETASDVGAAVADLWESTCDWAGDVWEDASNAASDAWDAASDWAEDAWDDVSGWASDTWNDFTNLFS